EMEIRFWLIRNRSWRKGPPARPSPSAAGASYSCRSPGTTITVPHVLHLTFEPAYSSLRRYSGRHPSQTGTVGMAAPRRLERGGPEGGARPGGAFGVIELTRSTGAKASKG